MPHDHVSKQKQRKGVGTVVMNESREMKLSLFQSRLTDFVSFVDRSRKRTKSGQERRQKKTASSKSAMMKQQASKTSSDLTTKQLTTITIIVIETHIWWILRSFLCTILSIAGWTGMVVVILSQYQTTEIYYIICHRQTNIWLKY